MTQEAGAVPANPPRVVVVVDDALLLREVYVGYLERDGFTVAVAADGVEALFQIKRLRPFGVVLDLLLPRLSGLDILGQIKAFDSSIRVVVVTGAKGAGLREQALALGASAVLDKPVKPEKLLSALTETAA